MKVEDFIEVNNEKYLDFVNKIIEDKDSKASRSF